MTKQHPISVPQELLNQWCRWNPNQTPDGLWRKIADNSAQWGADTELEKCCELLRGELNYSHLAKPLCAARRPKPPSLKEQALNLITNHECIGSILMTDDIRIIRKALETLPE